MKVISLVTELLLLYPMLVASVCGSRLGNAGQRKETASLPSMKQRFRLIQQSLERIKPSFALNESSENLGFYQEHSWLVFRVKLLDAILLYDDGDSEIAVLRLQCLLREVNRVILSVKGEETCKILPNSGLSFLARIIQVRISGWFCALFQSKRSCSFFLVFFSCPPVERMEINF